MTETAADTPQPIEILRVSGSHREVGRQMGEAGRTQIREEVDAAYRAELPAGRSRERQLELAAGFRAFTEPRMPWLIDELDGCAEGAGVDPLAFFATTIEELWYAPAGRSALGRCSDLVAGAPATADGHLLVGHTNDLAPRQEARITAIEKAVAGDPLVFQLGGVPWLSVGFNDAGLSLTGNELAPNDERLGISRSHQVIEMIRARSLGEMVGMALRPDRASSYNNVLGSSDGGVADVEGSATDAEVVGLDPAGHLAHTNHYVCDRMLRFEGDPDYAQHSAVRFDRARTLLSDAPEGSVDADAMRAMLSDHEGSPDAICRHPVRDDDDATKTVFWCVADVTEGTVTFGRGNPCRSTAQAYRFPEYASAIA